MRIGIVGTGFMGSTHAAAWAATNARIAGFVTRDEVTGSVLAAQYQAQIYPDLPSMLADVDVVDICTPTHLHEEMVLSAASAKKHILCEKPLARTLTQAQNMLTAVAEAGVKLMVAHVVRFFPEYAQAKAQVEAGAIGKPAVLRLTRGTFQPKKAADNWFVEFEKSGGMMLDLMIHDLDYARWVAGDVATVFAKNISSSFAGVTVDHGLAILTHRSGAISHVEGSWAYPPPLFRTRFEIAGDNGWLQYSSEEMSAIKLHLRPEQDEEIPDVPLPGSPLSEDPYTTEIKAFYDCLVKDTAVPVNGADGLAALQIALAAIESAQTGQPIHLQPFPEALP
ncbi:MAG: Gfo/Idh/MocA family oxidoreductase [Chloroflexi bacterium]|nr:Gfo/Idh/MocA family oxidoreductase [Chloroflexota bacterium]